MRTVLEQLRKIIFLAVLHGHFHLITDFISITMTP
jgi:hypothetical protein